MTQLGKTSLSSKPLEIPENIELVLSVAEAKSAFLRGEKYARNHDHEKATIEFLKVVKFNNLNIPEYENSLAALVTLYMTGGEYKRGKMLFEHLRDKFPDNINAHLNVAISLAVAENECSEYIKGLLTTAQQINDRAFVSFFKTGIKNFIDQGIKFPDCLKQYQKIEGKVDRLDVLNSFLSGFKTLGWYHGMSEDHLNYIEELYSEEKQSYFTNEERHVILQIKAVHAQKYIDVAEADKAIALINELSHKKQYEHEIHELYSKLAMVYFKRGDFNLAEQYTIKAFDKLGDAEIALQLGLIYGAQGKYDSMVALYKQLQEENSTDATMFLKIGASLYNFGEFVEAQEPIKKAYEVAHKKFEDERQNANAEIYVKSVVNLSTILRKNGEYKKANEVEEAYKKFFLQKFYDEETSRSEIPITVSVYNALLDSFKYTKEFVYPAYQQFQKHVINLDSVIIEDVDTLLRYSEAEFNQLTPEQLVQEAADTQGFVWEG